MSDIFNRNLAYAGAYKPESTFLTFQSGIELPANAIVRGLQLAYQQEVSRVWSLLGSSGSAARMFIVAGQTNGTLGIASLLSSGRITGDVCEPGSASLSFGEAICGPGAQATNEALSLSSVIFTSFGVEADSGSMQINRNMGATFLTLK